VAVIAESLTERSSWIAVPISSPARAAGTADVEELGHDPAVAGDYVGGAVTLPPPRGPLGLVVDGGHPTAEHEPQPTNRRRSPVEPDAPRDADVERFTPRS
jgi:hypothetical protein